MSGRWPQNTTFLGRSLSLKWGHGDTGTTHDFLPFQSFYRYSKLYLQLLVLAMLAKIARQLGDRTTTGLSERFLVPSCVACFIGLLVATACEGPEPEGFFPEV